MTDNEFLGYLISIANENREVNAEYMLKNTDLSSLDCKEFLDLLKEKNYVQVLGLNDIRITNLGMMSYKSKSKIAVEKAVKFIDKITDKL